jgi:uncharacterized protein YdaU (DUF1376 family)
MDYYKRYMGDYQRDTSHLSLAEHGAYTVLLDHYYSRRKPLPESREALWRLCRATSKLEQAAVSAVADEFFPIAPDGLRHNPRADDEIAKWEAISAEASESGRRGAEKRWGKNSAGHGDGYGESDGVGHRVPHKKRWGNDSGKNGSPAPEPESRVQIQKPDPDSCEDALAQNARAGATPPERGEKARAERDESRPPGESPGDPDPAPGPTRATAACIAMRAEGLMAVNPSHATLLKLLEQGAEVGEFAQAAKEAVGRGKGFGYALGIVGGRRADAARLATPNGHGKTTEPERSWEPPDEEDDRAQA